MDGNNTNIVGFFLDRSSSSTPKLYFIFMITISQKGNQPHQMNVEHPQAPTINSSVDRRYLYVISTDTLMIRMKGEFEMPSKQCK